MASSPSRRASTRPRSRPRNGPQASAAKAGEPIVLVVKRGALKRFDSLKKKTAGMPVDVVWDRRVAPPEDPVASPPRPPAERRQTPPFTWGVADFLVARGPRRDPLSD